MPVASAARARGIAPTGRVQSSLPLGSYLRKKGFGPLLTKYTPVLSTVIGGPTKRGSWRVHSSLPLGSYLRKKGFGPLLTKYTPVLSTVIGGPTKRGSWRLHSSFPLARSYLPSAV